MEIWGIEKWRMKILEYIVINPFSSLFRRNIRENFERWKFVNLKNWWMKILEYIVINLFNFLFGRSMRENFERWTIEICKFEELGNFRIKIFPVYHD